MNTRRWVSSVAVVGASIALSGCGARHDAVSAFVPGTWTVAASTGRIANPCFGSWEECGTVQRTYVTHSGRRVAIDDLARRLRGAGWTVESVRESRISAFDARDVRSETARVDAVVSDGRAMLTYVHE